MKNGIKDIVQAMSITEIIDAMISGLKDPLVNVNMGTYGEVVIKEDHIVCYGCAATNAICKIANISLDDFIRLNPFCTMEHVYENEKEQDFIVNFESAINELRCGNLEGYNTYARWCDVAKIPKEFLREHLPYLSNDNFNRGVDKYIDFNVKLKKYVKSQRTN